MKRIFNLLILLSWLASQPAFSRMITSPDDSSIGGGNTINFNNLPIGYIKDSASDTTISIDGVTFTEDTISIDGVTFSNGGDTHWYPSDEGRRGDEFKTIEIEGIKIDGGEKAWSFGGELSIAPSPNQILLQGTFESRREVRDFPGRLNVIRIAFNPPITGFGLIIGGNQPNQTLEIYNTDDELIETITRPTRHANYFTGYALDSNFDQKISYLKWGNKHSHDRLYMDDLTYTNRPPSLANWIRDNLTFLLLPLLLATGYFYRWFHRRYFTNRL